MEKENICMWKIIGNMLHYRVQLIGRTDITYYGFNARRKMNDFWPDIQFVFRE